MTEKLTYYEKSMRKNIRVIRTLLNNMLKKRIYPVDFTMKNSLECFYSKPSDPVPEIFWNGFKSISFTYNAEQLRRKK